MDLPFQLQILGNVALALLVGAVIGLDRELAEKPAGLRTQMLIAGSAALLVSLGDLLVQQYAGDLGQGLIASDPIRIVQAVIVGVSFLGAGTIIRDRSELSVKGLTTAATTLFSAGAGMAVALSQYWLVAGLAVLVLLTLRGVRWLEDRFLSGR